MGEKTERPKAIVDAHHDEAAPGELRSIGRRARADGEVAAVQPHQDGQTLVYSPCRCPHVECEAVFACRLLGRRGPTRACEPGLNAHWSKLRRIACFAPLRRQPRWTPAAVADRGSGIRNPLEDEHVVAGDTANRAVTSLYGCLKQGGSVSAGVSYNSKNGGAESVDTNHGDSAIYSTIVCCQRRAGR